MIYEVRTFQNDEGMTIIRRQPWNSLLGLADDEYMFMGEMFIGLLMGDGRQQPQRIPISFPIVAPGLEEAFLLLPAMYKQKCDETVAAMNGVAQKRKEAELRDILVRP